MSDQVQPQPPRRLLAIGDIHGCRAQLRDLLAQVAPSEDDRLVFLGDYIDRGADAPGVIDDLLELRRRFPQTIFLKGNHEQMLFQHLASGFDPGFLFNGGDRTLAQYERRGTPEIPREHRNFFAGLVSGHRQANHIFVHAGLKPGVAFEHQVEGDLLWIRDEFLSHPEPCEWGDVIVHGHTPRPEVDFAPCRIGLDTGAVYGRSLSCCDVLTRQVWQAW